MTPRRVGKRVALVRVDPNIEPILADALAEAGCQVSRLGPASADQLVRHRPDLILLEAGPHSEAIKLLDALREHPETVGVPVIVLGTMPTLQEQAQTSGNVYTVLPMPSSWMSFSVRGRGRSRASPSRPGCRSCQPQPTRPSAGPVSCCSAPSGS